MEKNMFISEAMAQAADAAATAQQGSLSGTLIQLGLIFLIFYVILIRPQQKRMKEHDALLASIKKGDRIITGGGIYGKVVKADDTPELVVEIADGVNITVNRMTVRDVVNPMDSVPANSNKKSKSKK